MEKKRILTFDANPGQLVDARGNPISTEKPVDVDKPQPTPEKPITKRFGDLPANTLFRHRGTGTIYMKLKDGSVRNMDKAARKLGLTKGLTRKQKRTIA